jgi:hypothetical protein
MSDKDHRASAAHILRTANHVVTTERGNQHGGAEDSFQMIADLWMVYLNNTNRPNPLLDTRPGRIIITPKDVALMMDLLKTARHVHGDPLNADNFVDKAGYTSLAGALAGIPAPTPAPATAAAPLAQRTLERTGGAIPAQRQTIAASPEEEASVRAMAEALKPEAK